MFHCFVYISLPDATQYDKTLVLSDHMTSHGLVLIIGSD